MTEITESGFLKLSLNLTIMGPLPKKRAEKIEADLLSFFKENGLDVEGKMQFIQVSTLTVEHNYSNSNTGETSIKTTATD